MKRLVTAGLLTILLLLTACSETTPQIEKVVVTFDSNGGSVIEDVELEKNSRIVLPNSDREGYEFLGWFVGEGVNEGQITNASIINQDIVLKAKWRQTLVQEDFTEGLIFSETVFEGFEGFVITSFLGSEKNVIIPDFYKGAPVIGIASMAFISKQIESIVLSKNTKFIGMWAFVGNQLTEITLPEGIKSIGIESFSENKLSKVNFPSTLSVIEQSAFQYNQLEKVEFLPGLVEIGERAFSYNKINEIQFPNTLVSIEKYAFSGNRIAEVEIPASVITIGREAFGLNPITKVLIQGDSSRFDSQRYLIGLPFDYRLVYLRSSGMENAQQFHVNNTIESVAQRNNVNYGEVIINVNPDYSHQSELFTLTSSPITQLILYDASDRAISEGFLYGSESNNNQFLIILNAIGDINNYNHRPSVALKIKAEEIGFIAGYIAVIEGNTSLAIINDAPTFMNIQYTIGFVAGAYYAADITNRNIAITIDLSNTYKTDELGNPSLIPDIEIKARASNLYIRGHDLIYALFSQRDVKPVIDAAELNSGKLILPSNDQFNLSETVITSMDPNYSDYLEILLNQYLRGTLRSNSNVIELGVSENAIRINNDFSRLSTYDLQRHTTLLQSIESGNMQIPSDSDELIQYLQNLGISQLPDNVNQLNVYYWLFQR